MKLPWHCSLGYMLCSLPPSTKARSCWPAAGAPGHASRKNVFCSQLLALGSKAWGLLMEALAGKAVMPVLRQDIEKRVRILPWNL